MNFFRRFSLPFAALMLVSFGAEAFCGFYVAQGNAKIFNKTSQVIVARKGKRNIITMANDFSGAPKDFALVVPVPVVLQEKDIRVVEDEQLFTVFDDYSAPRLVEYWDENPCERKYEEESWSDDAGYDAGSAESDKTLERQAKKLGVTIEAKYTVGEYDILILGAKESDGLATWLKKNGYGLPPSAEEVLQPYIKNKLKFFVVKVNAEAATALSYQKLRPIQIEYEYERFMLPIRLGMANADGDQDLIIYCLSDVGRVETVNYRTVRIPTDKNIPEATQDVFGKFYKATFDRAWTRESKKAVLLEYFWDISGFQPVKCDPCPGPFLTANQLQQAGAFWITPNSDGQGGYEGPLYFTRLHARYNRLLYPQDLLFQAVPSTENFQGRYIVNHPATGSLDCSEAKNYIKMLEERRAEEKANILALAGWTELPKPDGKEIKKNETPFVTPNSPDDPSGGSPLLRLPIFFGFAAAIFILLLGLERFLVLITKRFRRA